VEHVSALMCALSLHESEDIPFTPARLKMPRLSVCRMAPARHGGGGPPLAGTPIRPKPLRREKPRALSHIRSLGRLHPSRHLSSGLGDRNPFPRGENEGHPGPRGGKMIGRGVGERQPFPQSTTLARTGLVAGLGEWAGDTMLQNPKEGGDLELPESVRPALSRIPDWSGRALCISAQHVDRQDCCWDRSLVKGTG
jgi:hypothetical protein